jgi:hypothetical protein
MMKRQSAIKKGGVFFKLKNLGSIRKKDLLDPSFLLKKRILGTILLSKKLKK